jgi:glutamate formiminotransferase/formiminotetrahydrofolate cyclodeaminase
MAELIECIPNISEGRDLGLVQAVVQAAQAAGASVLDVYSGASTNRSVISLGGPPEIMGEAAFALMAKAASLIDMSKHQGNHPRIGATDVCPFVPLAGTSMQSCIDLAHLTAKRAAGELNIPVYLYGQAALTQDRQKLAAVRAGQYEGLRARSLIPDQAPDFPAQGFNAKSGATAVGARKILIAYNVNLETKDLNAAKRIAADLRSSSGPFYLRDCMALGWYIEEFGLAQVSINLLNFKRTGLAQVWQQVSRAAAQYNIKLGGSELVGLCPLRALLDAAQVFSPEAGKAGVHECIKLAVNALGLGALAAFDPAQKILEKRLQACGLITQADQPLPA